MFSHKLGAGRTHIASTSSISPCPPKSGMATQAPSGRKVRNPEDVRERRGIVLKKYQGFKDAAKLRRERLEGAKRFQQFKRDADELESWVSEKLQLISEDSFKDRTNLQVLPE